MFMLMPRSINRRIGGKPFVIIRLGRSATAHNRCRKFARSRGVAGQIGCYLYARVSVASIRVLIHVSQQVRRLPQIEDS
jgi:hypothetical protein